MSAEDSMILTGLGLSTNDSEEDTGVSPGSAASPYSTDLGSWMPCPFHQNIEPGKTHYKDIGNNPKSLLPFRVEPYTSQDYVSDSITMIAPSWLHSGIRSVKENEYFNKIGMWNSLRTNITCGQRGIMDGTDVNTSCLSFGGFSTLNNEHLKVLGFDPVNNKLSMTATHAALCGNWQELGYHNGTVFYITIVKTLAKGEDAFPDAYYGTYKVLETQDSGLSLIIDPKYKEIPGKSIISKECYVLGDNWLMNHAGYNFFNTPFYGLEPSRDINISGYNTEIVQDGGDTNPADPNWACKDTGGGTSGWSSADPSVYGDSVDSCLINTLSAPMEPGYSYDIQFDVGTASLDLTITARPDATTEPAVAISYAFFTAPKDWKRTFAVGTHNVRVWVPWRIQSLGSLSHLYFVAFTTSAGNGTIDNVSCKKNGYSSTPSIHNYQLEHRFKRTDALTTMYMPFDGTRGPTYQAKTGRTAKHRVRDVRFKASDVINGVAVIGNIDTQDDSGQTFRERNRIMWSTPMAVDEFGFFRSKMIGVAETGGIVSLKAFNGQVFCIKNNSSYILDPNNGFNEVGRILGAGADWASCVCRTPFGIMVANRKGIHVIPSKEELTLGIRETFRELSFSSPSLGFSAKHNELVFIPDTGTNGTHLWVFNFNSKGWSKVSYTSGSSFSNLLYGGDNELLMVKQEYDRGSQIVNNGGDFAGWTTTGWTIGSGDATHNTGNTNALVDTNGTDIVPFAQYIVTVNVDATGTAGEKCKVSVGGAGGTTGTIEAGAAGAYQFLLQAGGTVGTQLKFTPESDYDGKITSCGAMPYDIKQSVIAYSSSSSRDNTKLTLKTKDYIFEEPNASKYIKSLMITYRSKIGITVYIYADGVLSGQKQLPVNKVLSNRKIGINTECQSIAFKLESDNSGGTDDDFKIEDMTIEGWYNEKK